MPAAMCINPRRWRVGRGHGFRPCGQSYITRSLLEQSRIEGVIIEITNHNRKWGNICAYRPPPPSMNNSIFIDDFTAGVDRLHIHFDKQRYRCR